MNSLLLKMAVLFAAATAALAPTLSQAADVTLMPVNVHLDKNTDRTTVQVMNNGTEPVIMQAEAIAWSRVDGKDIDGQTSDIIVNPPVFTIKPGQSQVIRVGLRRSQTSQTEGFYRMVLREVPGLHLSDIGNVSGSVRVLVSLRVPIFVAPVKTMRSEQIKLSQDASGMMVAHVSNTGNVHMKLSELRLQGAGTEGMAIVAQAGPQAVLFPGEERTFKIARAASPAVAQAMSLQIMTDQGMKQVAFAD